MDMDVGQQATITGQRQAVPTYVTAIVAALVWLYITATTIGGGTLGMRAAHLRLVQTFDASPPGPVRVAARSLFLGATIWLLCSAHPALLLGYLFLAVVWPGRLPHDFAAGTAVVCSAPGF